MLRRQWLAGAVAGVSVCLMVATAIWVSVPNSRTGDGAAKGSSGNGTQAKELAEGAVPAEISLEQIAAQLADDSQRTAALQLLKKLPLREIAALRQLARATADPRAKADLWQRSQEMQEQLTEQQPPISIHVQNAPMFDLLSAWNREMATNLSPPPGNPPLPQDGLYTLDETDQPFWKTVMDAGAQQPIAFNSFHDSMFFLQGRSTMEHMAIQGPFCAYAYAYDNLPVPGMPPIPGRVAITRPLAWMLRAGFGIDPRLVALESDVIITAGKDDAGNDLGAAPSKPPNAGPQPGAYRFLIGNSFYTSTDLTIPTHPGKVISWVKAEGSVLLAVSESEVNVENLEAHGTDPIHMGATTITLEFFVHSPTNVSMNIKATRTDGIGAYVGYRWFDGQNTVMQTGMLKDSGSVGQSGHTGPYRIELRVPNRIVERAVAMEIKDVPLPFKAP